MAIVNGRRLYDSDKLEAVAREDDRAASEYAWLMAGISDDWGRFKLSPRRIVGKAYERRPAVTELLVGDWLALYEKHGLLKLYAAEGSTYAEWTNYMGDPPSQRQYHSCPEPPWATHKHNKECKFREHADKPARGTRPGTQPPTPQGTTPGIPPLLAVTAVPSVPSEQTTDSTAVAVVAGKSWSAEAIEDWQRYLGDTTSMGGRIGKALKPAVEAIGWASVRPMWVDALQEAVLRTDPSTYTPEQFGRTYVARLTKARNPELMEQSRSPPGRQTAGEKSLAAVERFVRRGGELDRPEIVREGALEIGDGKPATVGRRDG